MSLILSISDLSLKITKFATPQFPRAKIEPVATLEYAISGTSVGDGPSFEPKHIWTISALLTPEECEVIKALYAEFEWRRGKLPYQSADILLIDQTTTFSERTPRTRGIAPSNSIIAVGANIINYYAQFKCWWIKPPEFQEKGIYNECSFTLQETDKVGILEGIDIPDAQIIAILQGQSQFWKSISSDYSAQPGDRIVANVVNGIITLILPQTPPIGSEIDILKMGGSGLTIIFNGQPYMGTVSIIHGELEVPLKILRLIFLGGDLGWIEPDTALVKFRGYKISGTAYGNSPAFQSGSEFTSAFDGNVNTSYDYYIPSGGLVGIMLAQPARIAQIRFHPRISFGHRMIGGKFQGLRNGAWEDIYTITSVNNTWNEVSVTPTNPYTILRYLPANQTYASVAEIEFYGNYMTGNYV